MKKKIFALILACVTIVLLGTGCFLDEAFSCIGLKSCKGNDRVMIDTFGGVTNGIYMHRDLTLTDVLIVGGFDKDYYDAEELKTLWQMEIDEYNAEHDYITPTVCVEEKKRSKEETTAYAPAVTTPITVLTCSEKDGELTMQLTYANAVDYRNYNADEIARRGGTALKTGTLAAMDMDLQALNYTNEKGEPVNLAEMVGRDNPQTYRYIYCDFEAVLYGEGEIVAVSKFENYNAKNNCVTVNPGEGVCVVLYGD